MELIGISVDNVYTINTTAALNFKNTNVHIFEGTSSSETLNRGCENLLKIIKK